MNIKTLKLKSRLLGLGLTLLAGQTASAQEPSTNAAAAAAPTALPAWASKISLHNCAGAEATADGQGIELRRLPAAVRKELGEKGAAQACQPTVSEIRFAIPGKELAHTVQFTIEPIGGPVWVDLFVGDYHATDKSRIVTKKETLGFAGYGNFSTGKATGFAKGRFPNDLCRVVLSGAPTRLLGVAGPEIIPPKPEGMPPVMLCYGTSITKGAMATRADLGFAPITARMLGYDIVNLGLAGTAFCEPAMADHIAAQPWDLCLLEISVNMLADYSVEEFAKRAENLVAKALASHPKAPVVCISILRWNVDTWDKSHPYYQKQAAYRQALKDICAKPGRTNAYYIDGSELLQDYSALCQDILHPSDYGMVEIAMNLVPQIRQILKEHQAKVKN